MPGEEKTNIYQKNYVGYLLAILFLFIAFLVIARFVDNGMVSNTERSVFLAINGLPEILKYPMIAFQYLGLLVMPVLAALIAVIYRKYLLAVLFLLIMPAKIYSEKIIKANFHRERPKVYINDAILRGDVQASGLSFTSGHAIIVFAIVTLATPFVSMPIRIILWSLAMLCIFARIYLGAHLPLDVVGGAIIGVMVGLGLLIVHGLVSAIYQKHKTKKIIEE